MQSIETEGRLYSESEEIVHALFRGFFGRNPNPRGVRYWADRIEAGEPALQVLRSLLMSPEYLARKAVQQTTPDLAKSLGKEIDSAESATPLVVVDVGAQLMEQEDHAYSPILSYTKARVIGFEPLEQRRREREEAEQGNDLSLRPVFIADGSRHTFHINCPDATSSLLPLNTAITAGFAGLCEFQTVSTESVETTTLDEAVSDLQRIDFLKLDIQGLEHAALANARGVLARTLVVHCEVEFLPLYQGQPLFSDIDRLLRESGFRFVDLSTMTRYPYTVGPLASEDQLIWGDAVYFREMDTVSDPTHLLIQSFIAASVYGKASLARVLIDEHDRKTGASHAALFAKF